jgi:uncharacterized protein (DUF58 family)
MSLVTKEGSSLLTWFGILFFSGLILANSLLLCASLIPVFIYLVGVSILLPEVECRKHGLPSSTWVGGTAEVQITGRISSGLGSVIVCDELPKHFELIEGSNYKAVSKGFGEKTFAFSYKVRCTKRGNYYISGVRWESRHFLGIRAPKRGSSAESKWLAVRPSMPYISRIRPLRSVAYTTQPMESIAKTGPLSTDFKEIRDYVHGDPFKSINWKASARVAARGFFNPLVNEYEREGRQTVWIFLDAHPALNIGTSVENAFEYATQAANSIAYHFLNRGFRLGMYVYNDLGKTFYPETGKRQFIKISKELLELNPTGIRLRVYWEEGLSKALERNRKYLIALSPLIVIVTHVTSSRFGDLSSGLEEIWRFRRKREGIKTIIINVLPYSLIPKVNELEVFSARILEVTSRALCQNARELGAKVIDWNPKEEALGVKLVNF